MIEPIILKGFRDSLPSEEIKKKKLENIIEDVFKLYGFSPIDTPCLEYSSVLLGKGGGETDKQVFSFSDNGNRDVSMRFDLTVPLARFSASNRDELSFPFRRYQIGKVWRGEKPQKGRYREFLQCDGDIIGTESILSDYEILSLLYTLMDRLVDGREEIHLSHRGMFNSLLDNLNLKDKSLDILRTVDKKSKIGIDKIKDELFSIIGDDSKVNKVLEFINAGENKSFEETLETLSLIVDKNDEGLNRLSSLYSLLKENGIEKNFKLDPSITRGLDYYTGLVFETILSDYPSLGSVSSGGRYDNLASLYSKEKMPGVGLSVGLDRLIVALEENSSPLLEDVSSSNVLVLGDDLSFLTRTIRELRESNIKADLYTESIDKMKKIYDYTEKNHIPYTLTLKDNAYSLKTLKTRETKTFVAIEDVIKELQREC